MFRIDDPRFIPKHMLDKWPQLRELAGVKQGAGTNTPAKYRNKKTEANGIVFDSKKEADRYHELLFLQKAGIVTKIELQPRFLLQAAYMDGARLVRKMEYVADFRVTYSDGRVEVEDVKTSATKTKSYLIKRKLFRKLYPDIVFREVE
jgi:hypothetical protein